MPKVEAVKKTREHGQNKVYQQGDFFHSFLIGLHVYLRVHL